jgi:integrase
MACVTKRRDRWVLDFYDQHGERQRTSLPEGTTKGQAKEALREIEDDVAKGIYLPTKKIPLFSEVARDWLDFKKLNVRETYWEVCGSHLRNHFNDLNRVLINQITIATLEKFIAARQAQGMNINTLRRILVTLGQILSYAVRHRYIDHNPLRDAERPRDRGKYQEEGDKISTLNPDQIKTLLEHVSNPKYHTLFLMAIMTGARAGELLGLKWSDIDWNMTQPQVYIQRTFNKGRFFTPKTKNSRRKIDLAPAVVGALKKWRLACLPTELDLIFPNKAGSPMDSDNMTKRFFHPALKAAGLPKVRFHDLRHTYASLMIEQGENIKYVQNQLGHATPTVTLNVYAHLMKPANQEAVCRLENTLFGGNRSQIGHII